MTTLSKQTIRAAAAFGIAAAICAAAMTYPGAQSGPADKPAVDPEAAARGRALWNSECTGCHGPDARGTARGTNLLRTPTVMRDRQGSELGPFLKKRHPTLSGHPSPRFTEAQVRDLAHFLRQEFNNSFRGSPKFVPGDVLTGDPKAGEAYFNGPGKCASCHSPAKDLAGIGRRYRPVDLQQRFLFPARGRGAAATATRVTATVTPPSGAAVSGALIAIDDFDVTIRDEAGVHHTFRRTPGLKVEKNDPLAAHAALLDTITDKNIHDVVAYLETLK